jgi:hypothetical protein
MQQQGRVAIHSPNDPPLSFRMFQSSGQSIGGIFHSASGVQVHGGTMVSAAGNYFNINNFTGTWMCSSGDLCILTTFHPS